MSNMVANSDIVLFACVRTLVAAS